MRPDLDAIRARCDAATPGPWKPESEQGHGRGVRAIASVAWCPVACVVGTESQSIGQRDASRNARFIAHARADIPALLAYIDMLEHMLSEERENVDTLRARVAELEARANRASYTIGETEWAHRIAVAEQRFVDEYDARKAAGREIAELKARITTLEAMKP